MFVHSETSCFISPCFIVLSSVELLRYVHNSFLNLPAARTFSILGISMTELLPSSSGGVGGRGVLPKNTVDIDYNSSWSARPGGLSSGGGGIGNSGGASRLGSASGARTSRQLLRQEEGLPCGEGSLYLSLACAATSYRSVCHVHEWPCHWVLDVQYSPEKRFKDGYGC